MWCKDNQTTFAVKTLAPALLGSECQGERQLALGMKRLTLLRREVDLFARRALPLYEPSLGLPMAPLDELGEGDRTCTKESAPTLIRAVKAGAGYS